MASAPAWLDEVAWNEHGLVAAVVQDHASGEVLMLAWMNREALLETLAGGRAVFWSRSRRKLWRKGESSGHAQLVRECYLDCDADSVLLRVEQVGGIACHTGRRSCFYRRADGQGLAEVMPVLKDPGEIYGSG